MYDMTTLLHISHTNSFPPRPLTLPVIHEVTCNIHDHNHCCHLSSVAEQQIQTMRGYDTKRGQKPKPNPPKQPRGIQHDEKALRNEFCKSPPQKKIDLDERKPIHDQKKIGFDYQNSGKYDAKDEQNPGEHEAQESVLCHQKLIRHTQAPKRSGFSKPSNIQDVKDVSPKPTRMSKHSDSSKGSKLHSQPFGTTTTTSKCGIAEISSMLDPDHGKSSLILLS